MTAKSTVRTVILFEDEVRLAAKCLTAFIDSSKEDMTDEESVESVRTLISAMAAALNGADDDGAVLLLGRKTDMMLRREESAREGLAEVRAQINQ